MVFVLTAHTVSLLFTVFAVVKRWTLEGHNGHQAVNAHLYSIRGGGVSGEISIHYA